MCLPRVCGNASLDIARDLEEVPRRIGILRIVLADRRSISATTLRMAVFSSSAELADRGLVAAAALGPLLGQRAGRQRLAGLGLHLHRLQAVEVGRVVDDRRAAGGQVGEGDVRGGAEEGRREEKREEQKGKSTHDCGPAC